MSNWIPEIFDNALDGVSSAVSPELIQPTQNAWSVNVINRGSKPGTRPSFKRLLTLPAGLVQGASYFSVQGGMGVASINGRFYRLRINPRTTSYSEIIMPLSNGSGQDVNSPVIKQVFMQQTIETLVIQDGQSDPVFYNGSTIRRSDVSNEVPRGRQMAYGNGRLWVAVGGKNLVAGDIRSNIEGSELKFTETNYLSGGGTLFFPRGITGLAFIATTGTSDYGALMVFGSDYAESVRADITFRDQWATTPGFVTNVLRHTGCASHWSLTSVNQDLFWRDSLGGIRSIRSSLQDESGPGNAPISREVSRLTDFDSPQLLGMCSGMSFDNRLLMTSSPRLNQARGITWRDLISLDFAPISSMRGKTMPAYDGRWTGINFTHLFQGIFDGKSRAFAISHDTLGSNSLWEINLDGHNGVSDTSVTCSDGSGLIAPDRITSVVETRRVFFGNAGRRKRLERFDLYLSNIQGELDFRVYWRTDNNQKWLQWQESASVCAKVGDPQTGITPHVWKNLLPQQRPQLKTFTIPSKIDGITHYSLQNGFEFQIRIVWTGKTKIHKGILFASPLDNTDYALRDLVEADCLFNDVTGDDINFDVPVNPCPELIIDGPDDQTVTLPSATVFEQYDGPFNYPSLAFYGGFFRTAQVDGENRSKFQVYGGNPWDVACCVPDLECSPGAELGKGAVKHIFEGASTLQVDARGYTGFLKDTITSRGAWPSSAFIYPAPPLVVVQAQTIEDFKSQIQVAPFYAQHTDISVDYSTKAVRERFYTDEEFDGVHGFFGGGSGGQIWCLGYQAVFSYTDLITIPELGLTVARTGDPAKTQHLVGEGGNSYSGTTSRAKVSVNPPVGRTNFFIEYIYHVTPDNGDPAYDMTLNIEYPVTVPGRFFIYEEFPKIVDATVVSTKITVLYYKVSQDDLNQIPNNELLKLPSLSSWSQPAQFTMTTPNSETWDNFDTEVDGLLYILSFGLGWADIGRFYSYSPTEAYEDNESYSDGEFFSLYAGVGWRAFGQFITIDVFSAEDDFETTYPVVFGASKIPFNTPIFQFPGTSTQILIPANAAYDLGDFTIQAWVMNSVDNSDYYTGFQQPFFSNIPANVADGDGVDFFISGTRFVPPFTPPFAVPFPTVRLAQSGAENFFTVGGGNENPGVPQPGSWQAVTIVREGPTLKYYLSHRLIDQEYQLVGTANIGNSTPLSATGALIIGGRVNATNGGFRGNISEFRIWNFARTLTDLNSDIDSRLFGNETGLVGYFPLDEDSGSTVFDLSPTANNGTRGMSATIDLESLQFLGWNGNDSRVSNRWKQQGLNEFGYYSGAFTTHT